MHLLCSQNKCVTMTAPVVFGTTGSIAPLLDTSILPRFLALPQNGKIAAEYVWIGGSMSDLRSKTKCLDKIPKGPEDLPVWNYDGSSTGQAPGTTSCPVDCAFNPISAPISAHFHPVSACRPLKPPSLHFLR